VQRSRPPFGGGERPPFCGSERDLNGRSIRSRSIVPLLLFALGRAAVARADNIDLSDHKIAVAHSGISRSRGAMLRAVSAALAPSFGEVVRSKSKRPLKATSLRKVGRRLGADYVLAISEKKSSDSRKISVRLLDVENDVMLAVWNVDPSLENAEQVSAGR